MRSDFSLKEEASSSERVVVDAIWEKGETLGGIRDKKVFVQ